MLKSLPISFNYGPLIFLNVKLVDLIFIVYHVYVAIVLQKGVVLELNEFLILSHYTVQLSDLKATSINTKALISEISIQKPSKQHNLVIIQWYATQLTSFSVTTLTKKENKFPMGSTIEIVRGEV